MSDSNHEPREFLDGSATDTESAATPDGNTAPTTATRTVGIDFPTPVASPFPTGAPSYYAQDPLAGPPVGPRPFRPEPVNTSGTLGDVPPEIAELKWHWGAALLSTYWAKEHGMDQLANNWGAFWVIWLLAGIGSAWGFEGAWVVRALCVLAVFVCTFFFGLVGYREGWRHCRFDGGVPEYLEVQRDWSRKGLIITPLVLVGVIGIVAGCVWYIQANMPGGSLTRDNSTPAVTSTPSTSPTYRTPAPSYQNPGGATVTVPPAQPAPTYSAPTGTYTQPQATPQQPSATNASPAPAVDQPRQNYGTPSGGNQPNPNAAPPPMGQSTPNYPNPPANNYPTQPSATDQGAQPQGGGYQNQGTPPSSGATPQPTSPDPMGAPTSTGGYNSGGQVQQGVSGQ